MSLKLEYYGQTSVPVEVEGILPESVHGKSLSEIEKLRVYHGNREMVLADFFRVSGNPDEGHIDWSGDLSGVHWIGAKMTAGRMTLDGHGGRHIGSEMRGGEIRVAGDVGDWVGAEMRGGLIHVLGRAGHLVGSAYRGSARGMTGGTILVHGDAGNEIGHTMRRGLIAIGGNIGDLAGFNLLAGSLFFFGESGIRHGAGMRRGTIAFCGAHRPPLLPSFRRACQYRPEFLPLLFRSLSKHGLPVPGELMEAPFDLYHGDMIEGGRGEILMRSSA